MKNQKPVSLSRSHDPVIRDRPCCEQLHVGTTFFLVERSHSDRLLQKESSPSIHSICSIPILIAKKLLRVDLRVKISRVTASTSQCHYYDPLVRCCGFVTATESEKCATEEGNYLQMLSRHLQKNTGLGTDNNLTI